MKYVSYVVDGVIFSRSVSENIQRRAVLWTLIKGVSYSFKRQFWAVSSGVGFKFPDGTDKLDALTVLFVCDWSSSFIDIMNGLILTVK